MQAIKIILTGATGMVGEAVLLECLDHPAVAEVLVLSRKHYEISHPKVKELLVPDLADLSGVEAQLSGYDACFFCAGVSSLGMNEEKYTRITYDLTLSVANMLVTRNPEMVFCYVSGSHTDSTEHGSLMWARVKGRTENALLRLPFRKVYNFRPGLMKPTREQKNVPGLFKAALALYPLFKLLMPSQLLTMKEVGDAMINSVAASYPKSVLEIADIRALAAGSVTSPKA